ncbi:uncharacterized protein LOC110300942 [Mus caroli]|uniref:Uncharacterized protein LOC110300942 n=1 Tax=Mus caroli TaxID=10089 RepID=A0A6P7RGN4_MUSCR|nr:uncharacterized protein LOC110300942 [Mus caroli]
MTWNPGRVQAGAVGAGPALPGGGGVAAQRGATSAPRSWEAANGLSEGCAQTVAAEAPGWQRRRFSWAGRENADETFSLCPHSFAATLTEIAKVFKVGHLDFSNLWCGEYPCTSCLTSLFGRSDSIYSKDRVGDGLPLVLIEMTSSHLNPYSCGRKCLLPSLMT